MSKCGGASYGNCIRPMGGGSLLSEDGVRLGWGPGRLPGNRRTQWWEGDPTAEASVQNTRHGGAQRLSLDGLG